MENYVQSEDAGDVYLRPKAISMINPKDEMKGITYFMESIVNLKDGTYLKSDLGSTTGYFTDAEKAKTLKLYNPLTMAELGEESIGDLVDKVNTLLFSYMVYLRNPAPTQVNLSETNLLPEPELETTT